MKKASIYQVVKAYLDSPLYLGRPGRVEAEISRGRNHNSAQFWPCHKIVIVDGDAAPEMKGHPYLKTNFRNGSFSKVLYTPSTIRVIVGRQWLRDRGAEI